MEIRWNDKEGKIKLEADSNSLSTLIHVAESMISAAEERLEKMDQDALDPKDAEVLEYLQIELQGLSEAFSYIEGQLINTPSETEIAFYYQDSQ